MMFCRTDSNGTKERYVTISPQVYLACSATDWIVDTGANVHVISNRNIFSTYQDTSSMKVMMDNSTSAQVFGVRKIELKLTSGILFL
jgi:hypothetical protein